MPKRLKKFKKREKMVATGNVIAPKKKGGKIVAQKKKKRSNLKKTWAFLSIKRKFIPT